MSKFEYWLRRVHNSLILLGLLFWIAALAALWFDRGNSTLWLLLPFAGVIFTVVGFSKAITATEAGLAIYTLGTILAFAMVSLRWWTSPLDSRFEFVFVCFGAMLIYLINEIFDLRKARKARSTAAYDTDHDMLDRERLFK